MRMAKDGLEVGAGLHSPPSIFRCRVDGIPKAQGRPRAFRIHDRVLMFDPETSRDWKRTVTFLVAQEARKRNWTPTHEGVSLTLYFDMPRPKSLPKRYEQHIRKPDWENLAKAVCDALTGVLYHDDSQIVRCLTYKRYDPKPGVTIELEPVGV